MRRRALLAGASLAALLGGSAQGTLLTVGGGRVLGTGSGSQALSVNTPALAGAPYTPNPSSIAGLTSWSYAGNGASPNAVAALPDLTGNGLALTVTGGGAAIGNMTPLGAVVKDRLVGSLAGLRMGYDPTAPVACDVYPFYDPTGVFSVALTLSNAASTAVYAVLSRGNLAQATAGGGYVAGTIPLITIGARVVVGITNVGADGASPSRDTLTLFPGTAQAATISTGITQRFTHSLLLNNVAGVGMDVWLDDVKVLSAQACPTYSGALSFSAWLDYHEHATWGRALSSGDTTTLLSGAVSVSKQWPRGARQAVQIIVQGQSNSIRFCGADSGSSPGNAPFGIQTLCEAVRWTGGWICARPVLNGWSPLSNGLSQFGIPMYDITGTTGTAPWFVYASGQPSSAWTTGNMAGGWVNILAPLWTANSRLNGELLAVVNLWTETDSGNDPYSERANYQAARLLMYAAMRASFGKTAAQMPIYEIAPLPFQVGQSAGNGQGYFERQAFDAIFAGGNNVALCIGNTSDSLPAGASLNSGTGVFTGGDLAHRAYSDLTRFGWLMGSQIGASLIAQGLGEFVSSVPAGVPVANGPKVTAASVTAANTVTVTVQHDGGTALSAPLLAASGLGWSIMSGGSLASPGTVIAATACTVVDGTHLRLTFPGLGSPTVGTCLLFYGYGMVCLGPGSAIYDNYAAVTRPAGWDPAALSAAAVLNRPLQQVNALTV